MELPQYRCHKIVRAGKILQIETKMNGGAVLHLQGGTAVMVSPEYMEKHRPQQFGYFVHYEPDGYQSFSPAKAFEDGYTLQSPEGKTFRELSAASNRSEWDRLCNLVDAQAVRIAELEAELKA